MAQALTWTDVPRESAEALLTPPFSHEEDEEIIRECLGIGVGEDESPEMEGSTAAKGADEADLAARRVAVLVNMYEQFLSLARSLDFSERKLSTLLSIVRSVHAAATSQSGTIHSTYETFTSLLLAHSVERPPYSAGIFSPADVSAVTAFAIANYFQHFKLYQHAYARVGTLSVKAYHPRDFVDTPQSASSDAEAPLSIHTPLSAALTQRQKDARDEEERAREEERALAEEEERRRIREEEDARRVAEEYANAKAEDVAAQVAAAVAPQLARLEETMQKQFASKEEELMQRIATLEQKLAAAAPAE